MSSEFDEKAGCRHRPGRSSVPRTAQVPQRLAFSAHAAGFPSDVRNISNSLPDLRAAPRIAHAARGGGADRVYDPLRGVPQLGRAFVFFSNEMIAEIHGKNGFALQSIELFLPITR